MSFWTLKQIRESLLEIEKEEGIPYRYVTQDDIKRMGK